MAVYYTGDSHYEVREKLRTILWFLTKAHVIARFGICQEYHMCMHVLHFTWSMAVWRGLCITIIARKHETKYIQGLYSLYQIYIFGLIPQLIAYCLQITPDS